MFLNNIFQFFKGYVIIIVSGHHVGKFLNLCMSRRIKIYDVKYVGDSQARLKIRACDFLKLRHSALYTGCRVHIIKKCGWFVFYKRLKKNPAFLISFILFITLFILSTNFIWQVEVVGGEGMEREIREAVLDAGIRGGTFKPMLMEKDEIKNIILNRVDNITWAWVYTKGTKAVVEVKKAILPPVVIDKKTPCDIIAKRDGQITKTTIKDGIGHIKKGDVVLKGDLLIGGTVGEDENGYILRHAQGEIRAVTYHKAKATIKLYRDVKIKTGRKKHYWDLRLFSKSVPLYFRIDIPYEEYSIRDIKRELRWGKDFYLGVEMIGTVYEEEEIERVDLTHQQAIDAAKYELEKHISQNLSAGSVMINENVEWKSIDEDTIEVVLEMEFEENIGEESPIITMEKQE